MQQLINIKYMTQDYRKKNKCKFAKNAAANKQIALEIYTSGNYCTSMLSICALPCHQVSALVHAFKFFEKVKHCVLCTVAILSGLLEENKS